MIEFNETHDASLRSWVADSDPGATDFPIQNLPFGVFTTAHDEGARIGIAIGSRILDVDRLLAGGLLDGEAATAAARCRTGRLNDLMSMGNAATSALRLAVSRLLRTGSSRQEQIESCLIPMSTATLQVPARIGNFTDFFTSIHHANNASRVFAPNKPELPNFRSMPIAYHGRASSIVASGTPCVRPTGQIKPRGAEAPMFAPSRWLDYEVEVGVYVGVGNERNRPIALPDAEQHIFGLCLVNDWSARDIQGWEMLPLGPFLSKSFMTSVSPWVITLEALAPFRCPSADRDQCVMPLLSYLDSDANRRSGGVDIALQVSLSTRGMRAQALPPVVLGSPQFADQYWTIFQMIAHHTSNGCNLLSGDLLASGTVSGPNPAELGCMLELTEAGQKPVTLPNGESRRFLEDGDEVILSGRCHREGFVSIGFGECLGLAVSAQSLRSRPLAA